ncbi:lasso RiPP family leader peptide-containing protein [Nonomuraea sp. KM90]
MDHHATTPMPVGYEAPQLSRVGSFASSTLGSYSKDTSDDSDAGQYYTS